MNNIKFEEIKELLNNNTLLTSGKETHVYELDNEIVKIFYEHPNYPFERLNNDALKLLATLDLKAFNNITGFILDNDDNIVGYKENKLVYEEFLTEHLYSSEKLYNLIVSLDNLKDDIILLSEKGFVIRDFAYNYFYENGKLTFNDMTSYQHFNTTNEFLLNKILNDNLKTVNIFLIGLLIYDGYKKGSQNEYTLTYKSLQYCDKYCKNKYFGDVFKEIYSIDDNYRETKKV